MGSRSGGGREPLRHGVTEILEGNWTGLGLEHLKESVWWGHWSPGRERQKNPRVQAIAQAARELAEPRERWWKADLTPAPLLQGAGSREGSNQSLQRPPHLAGPGPQAARQRGAVMTIPSHGRYVGIIKQVSRWSVITSVSNCER